MRRWTATMAVALTASVVVTGLGATADAQTAPVSPADALRLQLVENRGVTMSEVTTWWRSGEKNSYRKKTFADFDGGTVAATDVRDVNEPDDPSSPYRYLTFKGQTYGQGGHSIVPEGKTWVLIFEDEETRPFLESGGIDLANPAALKAVLATTETKRPGGVYDGTRTTIHQGTITFAELYKVSPAFRDQHDGKPTGKYAKIKLSWRLWLGGDHLVRRSGPPGPNGSTRSTVSASRISMSSTLALPVGAPRPTSRSLPPTKRRGRTTGGNPPEKLSIS